MVSINADITDRKRAEERLLHDALHDSLTGLCNRSLFADRLEQALARTSRNPSWRFAVLILDLDRFKNVNDSLGHAAGDKLLIEFGKRLSSAMRQGDTLARLGGDEFGLLLQDIADDSSVLHIAERLLATARKPVHIEGREVVSTVSVGIAAITSRYKTADDMIRDADIALYRAKTAGRDCFELFDEAMHTRVIQMLDTESGLRRAVEQRELVLYYQPIINLITGRITGFEALLRWHRAGREIVMPAEFVPLAEDTGLIVPIGTWVIHEACRQLGQWQGQYGCQDPLAVNINLSAKQFAIPAAMSAGRKPLQGTTTAPLEQELADATRSAGLSPAQVTLEITETVLAANPEAMAMMLQRLAEAGFVVNLDDFGTGYSSLSYLYQLPINALKLDRSFIARIGEGGRNRDLVQAIINLAIEIGLEVTAEGVESPLQLEILRSMGCHSAQGYLFARPLPADQAEAMLKDKPTW
jgi:diguanylate cyclase (GGDEF)-like protein